MRVSRGQRSTLMRRPTQNAIEYLVMRLAIGFAAAMYLSTAFLLWTASRDVSFGLAFWCMLLAPATFVLALGATAAIGLILLAARAAWKD